MSKKSSVKIPSFAAVVIALIMALTIVLPSCTNEEETLSQPAQTFINLVLRIRTPITADHAAEIEAGFVLYEYIPEKDRSDETVTEQKQKLDGYKVECDAAKAIKEAEDAAARQEVLKNRFIDAVEQLPSKLTLANKADVEAARALYEQLGEQTKNANDAKNALRALVTAEEKIEELEHEAYLAEVEETATAFIEDVNALYQSEEDEDGEENGEDEDGEESKITLESGAEIERLLKEYEDFSDDVKNFVSDEIGSVADAKQKLDQAYEEYMVLKDADDIEKLSEYAEKLSSKDVTLDDKKDIESAESIYKNMSDNAKSADGVDDAYEIIKAARAEYDRLFAIKQEEYIQAFLAAAEKVPTDIENVNINWFDVLEEAGNAYWAIDAKYQSDPRVEEAFKRWDAAQMAFEKKGYKQIPMVNPNVQISIGDGNLVLANEFDNKAVTKTLYDFYGVSSKAELDAVAILYLHIYVDGEYQGKTAIKFVDIGHPGHIIAKDVVINALKKFAQDHPENDKVKSGANFALAISYEDKENRFIHSDISPKSNSNNVFYVW